MPVAVDKLASLAAEQRADIVVLWALGDEDGPLCGEVKVGLSKRSGFESQCKAMSAARSRKLARRMEFYIRGECAGLRLKTAVMHRLSELGCEITGPWFNAAGLVEGIAIECASIEGVRLMSRDDAAGIERAEMHKIMDRMG